MRQKCQEPSSSFQLKGQGLKLTTSSQSASFLLQIPQNFLWKCSADCSQSNHLPKELKPETEKHRSRLDHNKKKTTTIQWAHFISKHKVNVIIRMTIITRFIQALCIDLVLHPPPVVWNFSFLRTWPHSTPPQLLPLCPWPNTHYQCQERCAGSPSGTKQVNNLGASVHSQGNVAHSQTPHCCLPLPFVSASAHKDFPPESLTHPHSPLPHPLWQQ